MSFLTVLQRIPRHALRRTTARTHDQAKPRLVSLPTTSPVHAVAHATLRDSRVGPDNPVSQLAGGSKQASDLPVLQLQGCTSEPLVHHVVKYSLSSEACFNFYHKWNYLNLEQFMKQSLKYLRHQIDKLYENKFHAEFSDTFGLVKIKKWEQNKKQYIFQT